MNSKFFALVFVLLAACSQAPVSIEHKEQLYFGRKGVFKIVKIPSPQSISELARQYNTTPESIANANNTHKNASFGSGSKVKIPVENHYNSATETMQDSVVVEEVIQQPSAVLTHSHKEEKYTKESLAPKTLQEQLAMKEAKKESSYIFSYSRNNPDIQENYEEMPVIKSEPAPQNYGEFKTATPLGELDFQWPLVGHVLSRFKEAGDNEGINIEAVRGTAVHAAAVGEVMYIGEDPAEYGKLLIIKHRDGIFTAYAHAETILVKEKQHIRKGQVIAKVGSTGKASKPQLYFSVRKDDNTIDPEKILN